MVRQIAPKTQLGVIKSNVNQVGETIAPEIVYPESDGEPMADNTRQFTWIVKIKENLEILFKSNPDVFVAGDLFWYPVKGSNKIKLAPDTMVVFGRPKGHRGSYRQWEENNISPQVVFEILSPSNSDSEMTKKKLFYLKYGVEEYYVYDPDGISLEVSIRENNSFKEIKNFATWTSPRLNIRFDMTGDELVIYYPDGSRFLSPVELSNYAEQETQRAERERFLKEQETQRAEQERFLKEQETQRAEQERFLKEQEQLKYQTLLAQLKAKGIDITALE
ncbi:Uma2 family endonuclease [Cylindrospermopsis curvispora]|uniref:Uma2 family endonuclease n=1 Tax=Cylindrospermopsis curvispora GIHE-G1 TaxID=2666332 RepID=A0A7H0F4V2_9CYAN|nr:Uma2 family endonuclease [Cylindrospermopsis curvispora]QNP31068.1 Uma2 family endonuclease [Cylindrospermopsis curvispora GIHE-G1]